MEDDAEHVGNDLRIGYESLSSRFSDEDTQATSQSSKEAIVGTSLAPEKDQSKKHTDQATTMKNVFTTRPKPASSPDTSLFVVSEGNNSQRVTKKRTDPANRGIRKA